MKISQYLLRKEAKSARSQIEDNLVKSTLYWDGALPLSRIKENIANYFQITISEKEITKILTRLVNRSEIRLDDSYSLVDRERRQMKIEMDSRIGLFDRVNKAFIKSVALKLGGVPIKSEESIGDSLYLFVSSLLQNRVEFISSFLANRPVSKIRNFEQILKTSVSGITDLREKGATKGALNELFETSSHDFVEFFTVAIQNLVSLRVMNLDPDCQALEREAFSKKTLILDTNVVIPLLCEEDPLTNLVREVIGLTKSPRSEACLH